MGYLKDIWTLQLSNKFSKNENATQNYPQNRGSVSCLQPTHSCTNRNTRHDWKAGVCTLFYSINNASILKLIPGNFIISMLRTQRLCDSLKYASSQNCGTFIANVVIKYHSSNLLDWGKTNFLIFKVKFIIWRESLRRVKK